MIQRWHKKETHIAEKDQLVISALAPKTIQGVHTVRIVCRFISTCFSGLPVSEHLGISMVLLFHDLNLSVFLPVFLLPTQYITACVFLHDLQVAAVEDLSV